MSITVEFHPSPGYNAESEDDLNRDLVIKIVDGFGKESSRLSGQDVLIYFGMLSCRYSIGLRGALGILGIKNTPTYSDVYSLISGEFKETSNISNFEFIIYLSKNIRQDDNKIFKTFTIAHELQHVIQYIHF